MLTRVVVQSENPFYLQIRDARPTDSIIVEKIEGLDPPDVDLFMGDYARDGGFYSGRRVPSRDVTFTLGINPNYANGESVSGLRKLLYKTFLDPFAKADSLNVILNDDELPDRYFSGYTSKFDGDVFSDDTTVQISMQCPNPYLIDSMITNIPASGPTVPFSYWGSAETGLEVQAIFTTSSSTVQIDLNGTIMKLNYAFAAGDRLYINTNRGSRRIQVQRTTGGVTTTTDILYALYANPSTWLELHGQDNLMKIYGATSSAVVANLASVSFRAQHWGV